MVSNVTENLLNSYYERTVYLSDTDGAGVIYFANLLSMCHEAYEYALSQAGINFGDLLGQPEIAIPITHAQIDFFRPIFCGDELLIQITPQQISENSFELTYQIAKSQSPTEIIAQAMTRHVTINPLTRKRTLLPLSITRWLGGKLD